LSDVRVAKEDVLIESTRVDDGASNRLWNTIAPRAPDRPVSIVTHLRSRLNNARSGASRPGPLLGGLRLHLLYQEGVAICRRKSGLSPAPLLLLLLLREFLLLPLLLLLLLLPLLLLSLLMLQQQLLLLLLLLLSLWLLLLLLLGQLRLLFLD
jgi:hypothetical protein